MVQTTINILSVKTNIFVLANCLQWQTQFTLSLIQRIVHNFQLVWNSSITRRSDYFVTICIDYNRNPIDLESCFPYVGVMRAYRMDKISIHAGGSWFWLPSLWVCSPRLYLLLQQRHTKAGLERQPVVSEGLRGRMLFWNESVQSYPYRNFEWVKLFQ